MLFSSPVYSQASGSIAGVTYSHNKGGMYARARATPTDPQTSLQQFARFTVSNLSNRWVNTLTDSFRSTWELYAANVTVPNRLGAQIHISGLNHYIRSNAARHQVGLDILDQAPAIFDLGTFSNFVPTVDQSAGISIAFNAADDWNVVPGGLLVQAGMPVNPTVNYYTGPWRQTAGVIGIDTTPNVVPNPWLAIADQVQYFRVRASQADGRLSPATIFGPFVVIP